MAIRGEEGVSISPQSLGAPTAHGRSIAGPKAELWAVLGRS